MAYQLTAEQKNDFRRLTQKANRRIDKAIKEYDKAGLKVVPKTLTGGLVQSKSEWHSQNYALSRSVTRFKNKADFNLYMNKLRQFDIPEVKGGVPTYTEYKNVNVQKMKQAMRTALNENNYRGVPDDIQKALENRIDDLTVTEQKKFWKFFEQSAQKMGTEYSSEGALQNALDEFFLKEDIKPLLINSIVEAEGIDNTAEERERKRKLKYFGNQKLIDYLNKSRR